MPSDPAPAPHVDLLPDDLQWADAVMGLAYKDLEAARALLTRLLTIGDGLFATTVTVGGLFTGLATTTHSAWFAAIAGVIAVLLAYLEGLNWVHFRQISHRISSIERLHRTYIDAIRERGVAGPRAIARLRRDLSLYKFGVEQELAAPGLGDMWRTNRKRVRWLVQLGLAAAFAILGLVLAARVDDGGVTCLKLADGTIVQTKNPASVVGGSPVVVACPGPAPSRPRVTR